MAKAWQETKLGPFQWKSDRHAATLKWLYQINPLSRVVIIRPLNWDATNTLCGFKNQTRSKQTCKNKTGQTNWSILRININYLAKVYCIHLSDAAGCSRLHLKHPMTFPSQMTLYTTPRTPVGSGCHLWVFPQKPPREASKNHLSWLLWTY